MLASEKKNLEVVEYLLEKGANVNTQERRVSILQSTLLLLNDYTTMIYCY